MQSAINLVEEKISCPINIEHESNIELPISLYEDLKLFEEQLNEENFKNYVV